MKNILNELNPQYCRCPSGAAGLDVGYLCPGTCLDYAYEHHSSISFAFEIYASDGDEIHQKWENDHQKTLMELEQQINGQNKEDELTQTVEVRNEKKFEDTSSYSCFLQISEQARHHHQHMMSRKTREECFETFNPSDEGVYKETVAKWSEAFLKMCDMAAASALVRDLHRASQMQSGNMALLKANLVKPAVQAATHMLRMKESARKANTKSVLRGKRHVVLPVAKP